jgi:hypothetical protein
MALDSGKGDTKRYPLESLVRQLPHYDGPTLRHEKPSGCLQTGIAASPLYVWPDLYIDATVRADEVIVNSPVILVSAPGAMGKSVAAKAVAADLDAPLIDLSSLSVGSDTLTGLLARILGWTQAPKLINDLRSGQATIVLDGLDEAQLRAGREHTIAFLNNIVELVSGSAAAVGQVIIFGRREAIETSYLVLSENSIEPFVVRIAPLTHKQSNRLIDFELGEKTLNSKPFNVHRVHPVPFAELRDSLFREVASDLGASSTDDDYWNEVGEFLGYPPVLLVFAEHLAVENPAAELAARKEHSTAAVGATLHGDLLKKIVEGILDRESRKVRTQLSKALSFEEGDKRTDVLYTREEQSLRILKYTSGRIDIDLMPPAILSNGDKATYEELLSTFVPDHPFLNERGQFANVVFADYVRAFVAVAPLEDVHGASRAEILQACPQPGPFFADIVHSLAMSSNAVVADQVPSLDNEDLVDDLIKSYTAGSFGDSYFVYSQANNRTVFLLYQGDGQHPTNRRFDRGLGFSIANPSGVLELSSPLARCTILTPRTGVVLQSISDEVELGPDFTIMTHSLQIKARRFIALGDREADGDPGVFLYAKELDHEPILTIHAYPHSALQVVSPELWHMWRPYTIEQTLARDDWFNYESVAGHELVIGLRRILTSFRHTAMTGDPSIHRGWLDRYGTGSNPIFSAALQGLIELRIVELDGLYYRLQLNNLRGYGVSYVALQGSKFATTLKDLMSALRKLDVVKNAMRQEDRND